MGTKHVPALLYLVSLRISSCASFDRSRCASGSPYGLLAQATSVSTVSMSKKPVLIVLIMVVTCLLLLDDG